MSAPFPGPMPPLGCRVATRKDDTTRAARFKAALVEIEAMAGEYQLEYPPNTKGDMQCRNIRAIAMKALRNDEKGTL